MSKETAKIYEKAMERAKSPKEAWGDLKELAEDVDWDVEKMLED